MLAPAQKNWCGANLNYSNSSIAPMMTRAPPSPLANRYIKTPIISTTSHLLLNSSALILMVPLLTKAINENRIPRIPVIKGPRPKLTYGRNARVEIPNTVRIPSTSPRIPPSKMSRSPIFFKSAILDFSLLYYNTLERAIKNKQNHNIMLTNELTNVNL